MVASGYGQSLPWYFPFLRSYWRPSARHSGAKSTQGLAVDEALGASAGLGDGSAGEPAVAIRHLCKDFATTDGALKRAVDNLTLDVPAQQVTALLGERTLASTFFLI